MLKNKFVHKILLVVVCVSVLVAVLVVPSFALISPYTINAFAFRDQYGDEIQLHLPTIQGELRPIADSNGYVPEVVYNNLTTNVNLLNYGGVLSQTTVMSGAFPDGDYSFSNSNYAIYGSYDRGRVYENVPALQNTPFYGVQNSTNSFNLNTTATNFAYDGFTLNSISVNNFYVFNDDYSFITIDNPITTSDINSTYNIVYFDNVIGEFKTISEDVTLHVNSAGDYVINLGVHFINENIVDNVYIKSFDISFDTGLCVYYQNTSSEFNVRFAVTSEEYFLEQTNEMFNKIKSTNYQKGFQDGSGYNSDNWFASTLNAVDTFLEWEFIPNISFGGILTVVLGVVLVIAFLKFFAGG